VPLENRPITAQPVGLLGLLELRNVGRNPPDLGRLVVPQVDIEGFYLRGAQRWFYTGISAIDVPLASASGFRQQFTVPQDEWWYVEEYAPSISLGAPPGSQVCWEFVPALFKNATGYPWVPLAKMETNPAAYPLAASALTTFYVTRNDHPFWAPPGSGIGVQYGVSGTFANFSTAIRGLRYTPLKV